ncbi:MAG: hypothetical protein ACOH1N_12150 [Lutibacter sp.]
MKLNNLFLLSLLLLFGSCSAFKKELAQTGGQKEAIQNAILDFSNTSGLYKKDTVFFVSFHDPLYKMVLEETNEGNGKWVEGKPYQGIVAVNIGANYNKMLLTDSVKVGKKGVKIPTRYIEKDSKLFYWWDDNYPLTQEALDTFGKYNLLAENNLDGVIEFYDFKINDAQKGVDYYFCKNDLTQYKKITTDKGIGFYDAPSLDCNSQ